MKRLIILFVGMLFLFSCDLTVNKNITSQYLVDGMANGSLDIFLRDTQIFRHKGKPGVETLQIGDQDLSNYESCFILHVETGTTQETTVSSAIIKLDGLEILNNSDFSKNVGRQYTFEICDLIPTSALTIKIAGKPGSYLDIWIEGKLTNTVTDCDGNSYKTVKIGDQVWMAENLKTTKYCDNEAIPLKRSGVAISFTEKAYFWYDNDISNKDVYGALYTWAAAMKWTPENNTNPGKVQGACPTGWHIPSYYEWVQLETYLGGSDIAGGKMKETGTVHWASPNAGATNESGFSAQPGGYLGSNYENVGEYSLITLYGIWWNSTSEFPSRQLAYRTILSNDNTSSLSGTYHSTNVAFSVRCVKD
jgi:uncharacterized protein (TIGR02145 family)